MPRQSPYAPELRERAVRLLLDHRHEYASEWAAITSITSKLNVHRQSLRAWVRKAQADAGQRQGLTTDDRARLGALERENRELPRANEILKKAAAFFARAELDRRPS